MGYLEKIILSLSESEMLRHLSSNPNSSTSMTLSWPFNSYPTDIFLMPTSSIHELLESRNPGYFSLYMLEARSIQEGLKNMNGLRRKWDGIRIQERRETSKEAKSKWVFLPGRDKESLSRQGDGEEQGRGHRETWNKVGWTVSLFQSPIRCLI